ncbi:hypothetical protein CEXT_661791 [Caerostris extrusa]|uniref:Uncharacterized protein n=1 Tax=Caerostris extrusa TaxID=172846 RepID=A0AAV4X5H5_CAEEX|nr:hypothetical protein CEXT_661791 [Caerostris extrusa]
MNFFHLSELKNSASCFSMNSCTACFLVSVLVHVEEGQQLAGVGDTQVGHQEGRARLLQGEDLVLVSRLVQPTGSIPAEVWEVCLVHELQHRANRLFLQVRYLDALAGFFLHFSQEHGLENGRPGTENGFMS